MRCFCIYECDPLKTHFPSGPQTEKYMAKEAMIISCLPFALCHPLSSALLSALPSIIKVIAHFLTCFFPDKKKVCGIREQVAGVGQPGYTAQYSYLTFLRAKYSVIPLQTSPSLGTSKEHRQQK